MFSTNTQQSLNFFNLRYSAFLGQMYVSNDGIESLIAQAKSEVTEAEVKKGFTGYGVGATGKALAFLRSNGFEDCKVFAQLRKLAVETNGNTTYLKVGLRSGQDYATLSVPISSSSAQMLIRKLTKVSVGTEVSISMFAECETKGDKTYANHGVSVKVAGAEVPGDPMVIEALKAAKVSLTAALNSAGVDDPKAIRTAVDRKAVEIHTEAVKAYNAAILASQEADESADEAF